MRNEGLLTANFEQSKKVVSKKILTEKGAQIGLMSSMSFLKRVEVLIAGICFLGLLYAVCVGLPRSLILEPQETILLSDSTIELIHWLGKYSTVIAEKLFILHFILLVLNLIRKPNYAFQLAYGNLTIILLIMELTIGFLPITIGLTIGAFGWIGFALQLLVCLYLWKTLVLSSVNQLKQRIYQGLAPSGKDLGESLMVFIKKYGGILLIFSILNRWTFNFGEIVKIRPDVFSFLYGWAFIVVASLMIFMLSITLENFVAVFYFFKYQKEYRQFFKVSNEQWYGKWRGKMMDKKKK